MSKSIQLVSRILLALLMLVPGLTKLFVYTPEGVSKMLSGIILFAWAPLFWAYILIASEILFGFGILANFKLNYVVIPPIIILTVATLFSAIKWTALATTQWTNVLFHLIAIMGYLELSLNYKKSRN